MGAATENVTLERLHVDGEWLETGHWMTVGNPYDGAAIARVPAADDALVDRAVASARRALRDGGFPLWRRAEALERAAVLVRERHEDLARVIAAEAGKPIKQARVEAARCHATLAFSAAEARKLSGETVPMAAAQPGEGKLGLTLRLPLGVVAAISPFNFPLNLVAHKVGPALAAGNAVVLKPASATPISAIRLVEILLESGVPEGWLHVVCGPGGSVGERLVQHEDVAAISFTGSVEIGWGISARAPRKRVKLELGSNAPLIVDADADWERACDRTAVHAFSHAGQSCVSVQRIVLHEDVSERFVRRLVDRVGRLVVGDPLDPETDVGPVIDVQNRDRVASWIEHARASGAEIAAGGQVNDDGTISPTVVVEPGGQEPIWCEEVFGPVVAIRRVASFDEAIEVANASRYGLHAGVFTRDIGRALRAAAQLEFGGVLVNEVPTFRTDQQPYGGVKDSGNTREGPAYAIQELTHTRFVSLQG